MEQPYNELRKYVQDLEKDYVEMVELVYQVNEAQTKEMPKHDKDEAKSNSFVSLVWYVDRTKDYEEIAKIGFSGNERKSDVLLYANRLLGDNDIYKWGTS